MNTPEEIVRAAAIHWEGDISRGKGTIKGESGQVSAGYSFGTRFSNEPGTNPEELLGASHAACFTMALAAAMTRAGTPPIAIDSQAHVHLRRIPDGFEVSRIDLATRVRAEGVDPAQFAELANGAKEGCPISKALRAVPMTLDAKLDHP